MRRFRKQRQAETDHAVGAELQQHAGEHYGTGRRCFHVCVRQPGVQREERHFDSEREKERQEQQHLRARLEHQLAIRQRLLNRWQIEGSGSVVEPDDADQHQNRSCHGVEHKFHSCIDAALVPPDADQKSHGNQHELPEEKKEKHVEGEEDADDADFQQQQHHEELFHAMLDAAPRSQNRNGRQERSQQHEKHADAVGAKVIVNRRCGDPLGEFFELISGSADGHAAQQDQRKEKFCDGHKHGDSANEFVIVAAQHHQSERAGGGEEDQHRKEMSAGEHQCTNPNAVLLALGQKKMTASTTIAPATTHTA